MPTIREGTVVRVRPRTVTLAFGDGPPAGRQRIDAFVRGQLKAGPRRQTHVVAVNDRVRFETEERRSTRPRDRRVPGAVVTEVLPRRNQISRVDPGSRRVPIEHVLAANLDWLVVVGSLGKPVMKPRTLDRLLVLGETAEVPILIVFNKVDLEPALPPELSVYPHLGYEVVLTSAIEGTGVDALRDHLQGKVGLVIGPSGVGKSSLLNVLVPGIEVATAPVSEATGKGVHTTTHVDYHDLPGAGALLDSPGIRSVQPWGLEPGNLGRCFPEFREALGRCQFRDCRHRAEPGCAVHADVEAGEIAEARHGSYLKMLEGLESARAERAWDVG